MLACALAEEDEHADPARNLYNELMSAPGRRFFVKARFEGVFQRRSFFQPFRGSPLVIFFESCEIDPSLKLCLHSSSQVLV